MYLGYSESLRESVTHLILSSLSVGFSPGTLIPFTDKNHLK